MAIDDYMERYADELFSDDDDPTFDDETEVPALDDPWEGRGGLSAVEAAHLQSILAELHGRDQEALALYEPLPEQERFHASQASERLIVGGNRGGKTLAEMVELARALTGQDPHGKYSPRGGVALAVGKNLRHCAKVFYQMLFEPNAFKTIFDPELGRTRSFRPGHPWDEANRDKARPAPPLIPKRFYRDKDVSWDNKRDGVIKSIKIRATGWTLNFFSSEQAPPNGWRISLGVFDEEIEHHGWYTEINARLLDFREERPNKKFINGRFIWGATPQAGTVQLFQMAEAADSFAADGVENPPIQKFHVSLLDNPHISEQAKEDLKRKLANNEDEYDVRILGKFAILGSRVYPEFGPKGPHAVPIFTVPDDWCRFMALDPGRQVCAALFLAVPPPSIDRITLPDGNELYVKGKGVVYDEIYLRRSTAALFADTLKRKLIGSPPIHQFIIDFRNGRIHEIGSGVTHERQFANAMKSRKIASVVNGSAFTWAAVDDVKVGIAASREKLAYDIRGFPEWYFMVDRLPNFVMEMKGYVYKKIPGTQICTDEPWQRDNHLMDCFRYLSVSKTRWYKPPANRKKGSIVEHLEKLKRKEAAKKKSHDNGGATVKLW